MTLISRGSRREPKKDSAWGSDAVAQKKGANFVQEVMDMVINELQIFDHPEFGTILYAYYRVAAIARGLRYIHTRSRENKA